MPRVALEFDDVTDDELKELLYIPGNTVERIDATIKRYHIRVLDLKYVLKDGVSVQTFLGCIVMARAGHVLESIKRHCKVSTWQLNVQHLQSLVTPLMFAVSSDTYSEQYGEPSYQQIRTLLSLGDHDLMLTNRSGYTVWHHTSNVQILTAIIRYAKWQWETKNASCST